MPTPIRNYKGKDAEMLIATSTIIESAITNKEFLTGKRATWADPFFDNLKTLIDTSIQTNLGIDGGKNLRQSTQAIKQVQVDAMKDLALFKVQFTEDFKKEKVRSTEIQTQLGFTTYLKKAQAGDQEALISLLYQFKINMAPALSTEISSKGTDPKLISNIIDYADILKEANVNQETFKGSKKTVTAAALNDFNSIYDKVISIAKISSKLFIGQPEFQSQFSYSKVLKAMNSTKQPPQDPKSPK